MHRFLAVSCAAAVCSLFAASATATPMTYSGVDVDGSGGAHPNAHTAAANFDAALATQGQGTDVLTFDDVAPGAFSTTTIDGTTLAFAGQDPSSGISNNNSNPWSTFATSGNQYLFMLTPTGAGPFDTSLTYTFANHTDAFGAYLTGLGTDATFTYSYDAGTQTLTVDATGAGLGTGATQVYGFTDFGNSFSTLVMNLHATPGGGSYGVGVDDVTTATPEPAPLSLLGLGLAGALGRRFRRK